MHNGKVEFRLKRIAVKSPSIIVVSPFSHGPGHPYAFGKQLFLALRKRGFQVDLVTTLSRSEDDTELKEVKSLIHASLNLPFSFYKKLPLFIQKLFFKPVLVTILCLFRALLILPGKNTRIYHFVDGSPVVIALTALVYNCRVILQIWQVVPELFLEVEEIPGFKGLWLRLRKRIYAAAIQKQRMILVTDSEGVANKMTEAGVKTSFIRYAIAEDQKLQDPGAARESLNIPAKALTCLLFGTQRPDKDYETVFQALKDLPGETRLLIAGQSIFGVRPEILVAKYPEVSVIMKDEFIPEQEAAKWFAASDVVILPYRDGRVQGSGLVYEALRYERPSITTEGGFLGQFIRQYETGLTYRDGDAEDLRKVISRFLGMSGEEREKLLSHLRAVKQQHGWSARVEEYIGIYHAGDEVG
jgi:glycosyltransferase involved in cell wall biosynthesis